MSYWASSISACIRWRTQCIFCSNCFRDRRITSFLQKESKLLLHLGNTARPLVDQHGVDLHERSTHFNLLQHVLRICDPTAPNNRKLPLGQTVHVPDGACGQLLQRGTAQPADFATVFTFQRVWSLCGGIGNHETIHPKLHTGTGNRMLAFHCKVRPNLHQERHLLLQLVPCSKGGLDDRSEAAFGLQSCHPSLVGARNIHHQIVHMRP
mmetsp:Transcript_28411/g.37153  ORF Transcript_28411/g.37153 Transcript_28411/m.37153 type:complete len:209 (-) Transcript_28411:340-966(-)